MTIESHYQYLEEEVKKKEADIQDKERQQQLLRDAITMDRKLLKIMQEGLERMKAKSDQK